MPKGSFNPLAKSATCSGLPVLVIPRKTLMFPALVSATKKSPFGAVRIMRGYSRLPAYSSTLKPSGTFGHAPSGRATTCDPFSAEGVTKGAGRSFKVILRVFPGFS